MALTQADYDSIYETLSNDTSGAVVMYGTVVERREDGTAAVDVGTGTIAAEALSSIDIGGAMGERVVMLVQDNLATIIGVVGDEVTSHIITNLTNDMDATNAAIAGIRTDIETVGEEAQKAFDRADEVGEYADKLAATITDVQTTVTEQGVLIEGVTSTANAALEASTELQVDLDGFKTTVSQTYATQVALEQETLDRQSEIAQTVSDITTTVSETYATKSALSDEVAERESSIAQSASEVLTTVSENYVNNETGATYASKTELSQTAEDLTVSISAAASTANTAASTANSAASGVETLNTMIRMDADGVTVGQSADNGKTYESARTRVGTDGAFTIMDTDGTELARYGAAKIELGTTSDVSTISLCNGNGVFEYSNSLGMTFTIGEGVTYRVIADDGSIDMYSSTGSYGSSNYRQGRIATSAEGNVIIETEYGATSYGQVELISSSSGCNLRLNVDNIEIIDYDRSGQAYTFPISALIKALQAYS